MQMQDKSTYVDAGWDFLGEKANGTSEWWLLPGEDRGCPQLSAFHGFTNEPRFGQGTSDSPYQITDVNDMGAIAWKPEAHYVLVSDVNVAQTSWSSAVVPLFMGELDGNGLAIENLFVTGQASLGLIGHIGSEGIVKNLSMTALLKSGTFCFSLSAGI